jgi:hypothetical protein
MMGICSFFGLSRGLSLLAEVVRMLNGWERRESQRGGRQTKPRWLGCPSALWRLKWRLAPAAVLGSWVVTSWTGLDGSLGAPLGAPKARQKWT